MRVTPHHALQLTCCRMQLFELSLSLFTRLLHEERACTLHTSVNMCGVCEPPRGEHHRDSRDELKPDVAVLQ